MSVYFLLQNITATQTAPSATNPPQKIVNPAEGAPPPPVISQGYQVIVTSTTGTCSGTVQIMACNDGVTWTPLGSAIVVASAASPATAIGSSAAPYEYFAAYCTAISGTGASLNCTMSA